MGKRFKDLDLNNAFLFAATMSDPDTCKLVLEIILGEELPPVTVHTEHTVLMSSDFRTVRFDVYATDELQVSYNIESQNYDAKDLPMRSRFHQAEMDVMSIKPGQRFQDLKPAYVIFVCTFDPFGKGLYKYTFENMCQECDIALDDGAKRIFLNTKGSNADEVPLELQHFLGYVQQSTDDFVADVNDANISKLHERVMRVKDMKDLEEMFMTGAEWLENMKAQGYSEGHAQGLVEGHAEGHAQGLVEGHAEGHAQGHAQGHAEGCLNGIAQSVMAVLSELGTVPADVEAKIMSESETEVLMTWVKLASKASSIQEFIDKM